MIPQFDYSDWRFRTGDTHWNEAGNMVAAHCLYRFLEEWLKLPRLSETALANARHEYYSAVGTGWNPPADWVAPLTKDIASAAGIVAKYMELDDRHRVSGKSKLHSTMRQASRRSSPIPPGRLESP